MANPFVSSVIASASPGVPRQGFGVPMRLSYNADHFGAARSRTYKSIEAVAADFGPLTEEYRDAQAFFSYAARRLPELVIGRGANKPTTVYTMSIATYANSTVYPFVVRGDGYAPSTVSVSSGASDITISAASSTADTFTSTAHGMATGDSGYISSAGTLPTGVAINTLYWVIVVDANTFKLATTRADALAGTAIDLTSNGSGTHTLTRTGNDVLVDRIVAALNGVASKNYTAAATGSTGSKTWTVTASTAGAGFVIGVDHSLVSSAITNADPGIAADLTAIRNENRSWYTLHIAHSSTAMVLAAAAWIESSTDKRLYLASTSATATVTAAVGSAGAHDVADQLKTLAYARTSVWYHPSEPIAARLAGRILSTLPGSIQAAHKTLVGCTPVALTDTQRANLINKNANSYAGEAGQEATFLGKVAVGEWLDTIRNYDFVNVDMEASLLDMFRANDIVGMDPTGLVLVKAVINDVLNRAVRARIFRGDDGHAPTIEMPPVEQETSINRAARKYTLARWSAENVGAIVFLDPVTGSVST